MTRLKNEGLVMMEFQEQRNSLCSLPGSPGKASPYYRTVRRIMITTMAEEALWLNE